MSKQDVSAVNACRLSVPVAQCTAARRALQPSHIHSPSPIAHRMVVGRGTATAVATLRRLHQH